MADTPRGREDDLNDFFSAADSGRPGAMRRAAKNVGPASGAYDKTGKESSTGLFQELARAIGADAPAQEKPADEATRAPLKGEELAGKFIAIEPEVFPDGETDPDRVFVLVPAHIHQYVPWWGWVTILLGLLMLIAGVVLMPLVTIDRMASRLGDANDARARHAMQQLVLNGNERTVKKLYGMATSEKESLAARLRAVDTMSLIERVPEVDRALLRLELSAQTNEQIREAAVVARKQREAYKTRGARR